MTGRWCLSDGCMAMATQRATPLLGRATPCCIISACGPDDCPPLAPNARPRCPLATRTRTRTRVAGPHAGACAAAITGAAHASGTHRRRRRRRHRLPVPHPHAPRPLLPTRLRRPTGRTCCTARKPAISAKSTGRRRWWTAAGPYTARAVSGARQPSTCWAATLSLYARAAAARAALGCAARHPHQPCTRGDGCEGGCGAAACACCCMPPLTHAPAPALALTGAATQDFDASRAHNGVNNNLYLVAPSHKTFPKYAARGLRHHVATLLPNPDPDPDPAW